MSRLRIGTCVMLAIAIGWLMVSCASMKEVDWTGKNIDETIATYGPPTKVTPNPPGKLYVWERTHSMQGDFNPGTGGSRQTLTTMRMFTVDANGVITSYRRVDQ